MSLTINKILFPTDLSIHSRYAFDYAAAIAVRYNASVVILHVLEELQTNIEAQLALFLGVTNWKTIRDLHLADTKETLVGKMNDKAKIRLALKSFWHDAKNNASGEKHVEDKVVVMEGNLVETIIEQAKTRQCDLIVMTYYARNMIAEAMMSGVTRRVLRRSKKPVLLVPKKENG
ncbi:universal stress protein [Thermodesulfobacteriota bacterium]